MTEYIFDPSIDDGQFDFAKHVSNDPIRQVGSVLVFDSGDYYVGFNFIRNLTHLHGGHVNPVSDYIWKKNRALGRLLASHAEETAVLEAVLDGQTDFSTAVLYVSLDPCKNCRSIIEAAGIQKVIFSEHYIPSI